MDIRKKEGAKWVSLLLSQLIGNIGKRKEARKIYDSLVGSGKEQQGDSKQSEQSRIEKEQSRQRFARIRRAKKRRREKAKKQNGTESQ